MELDEANTELADIKRIMIDLTQQQKERDEKIKFLSTDLEHKTAEAAELAEKLEIMSIDMKQGQNAMIFKTLMSEATNELER